MPAPPFPSCNNAHPLRRTPSVTAPLFLERRSAMAPRIIAEHTVCKNFFDQTRAFVLRVVSSRAIPHTPQSYNITPFFFGPWSRVTANACVLPSPGRNTRFRCKYPNENFIVVLRGTNISIYARCRTLVAYSADNKSVLVLQRCSRESWP